MPEKLIALLNGPDEKLFRAGACHIFARELVDHFSDRNYEFCRMESEQWTAHPHHGEKLFSPRSLVHVYARRTDQIADIKGIRWEGDYLAEYKLSQQKFSGLYTYFTKIYTRSCSKEELFTPSMNEEDTGPMNEDRLYLDEEFVLQATKRARGIIERNQDKFTMPAIQNPLDRTHSNYHKI